MKQFFYVILNKRMKNHIFFSIILYKVIQQKIRRLLLKNRNWNIWTFNSSPKPLMPLFQPSIDHVKSSNIRT